MPAELAAITPTHHHAYPLAYVDELTGGSCLASCHGGTVPLRAAEARRRGTEATLLHDVWHDPCGVHGMPSMPSCHAAYYGNTLKIKISAQRIAHQFLRNAFLICKSDWTVPAETIKRPSSELLRNVGFGDGLPWDSFAGRKRDAAQRALRQRHWARPSRCGQRCSGQSQS